MFQINGAKMGFVPATPIHMYITAVRPRMLQLGGEIGDGVLLSGGLFSRLHRKCADDIASRRREGRQVAAAVRRRRFRHRGGVGRAPRSDRSQQAVSRLHFSQRASRRKYSLGRRHGRSGRARGRGGKTRLGRGEEIYQRRSRLRPFRRRHAGAIAANSSRRSSAADWICRSFCPPERRKRASGSCAWCARLVG